MSFVSTFDTVWRRLGYPRRQKFVVDLIVCSFLLAITIWMYTSKMVCGQVLYAYCECPCADAIREIFNNATALENVTNSFSVYNASTWDIWYNISINELAQKENLTKFAREYAGLPT